MIMTPCGLSDFVKYVYSFLRLTTTAVNSRTRKEFSIRMIWRHHDLYVKYYFALGKITVCTKQLLPAELLVGNL